MLKLRNNKAQLAMWIIISVFIIGSIVTLTVLSKEPTLPESYNEINFQSKIEKCIRDSVIEAVEIMLPQGGFLEPKDYREYQQKNITYHCKNIGNFKTCINQHPMLINEEINEILSYIEPRAINCFDSAKSEFEKRDYSINMSNMNLNVSLAPDKIFVDVDRKITISKNEKSSEFNGFHISVDNPLYDLSRVAIEITNQEAKYCYFEYVGYMVLYQRFSIEKFVFSDSTKIYMIKDKNTDKTINIATRSCVIPGGL